MKTLAERVAEALPCWAGWSACADCDAAGAVRCGTCALRPAVLALLRELREECARKVNVFGRADVTDAIRERIRGLGEPEEQP